MKTILITGGAGFIAHHLISHIIEHTDWNIVTIDRLDYSGNLNRLHQILDKFSPSDKQRVKIVFHDLKAPISSTISSSLGKIDIIAHLAASSHVDRSIEDPMGFAMDNCIGTINLLDYARTIDNLDLFLYFSTDEVFGPAPDNIKYKEYDRYNSTNPYSASKAAGEEFVVAYENTYGLPCAISHTMNVFGERQSPEKFIPMCIQKIRDDEVVTIHSNRECTKAGSRHYIHAQDVANAVLHIYSLMVHSHIKPEEYGGAKCNKFNIVGEVEIDNLELAKSIAAAQNKELKYKLVDFHSSRPGHDLRYALDGGRLSSSGFKAWDTLGQLERTVHWTLKNPEWLV
jgi:dTDP-glucose 4,6-dehydratase